MNKWLNSVGRDSFLIPWSCLLNKVVLFFICFFLNLLHFIRIRSEPSGKVDTWTSSGHQSPEITPATDRRNTNWGLCLQSCCKATRKQCVSRVRFCSTFLMTRSFSFSEKVLVVREDQKHLFCWCFWTNLLCSDVKSLLSSHTLRVYFWQACFQFLNPIYSQNTINIHQPVESQMRLWQMKRAW